MSEAAILEKIESLSQTVARLQERVEDLEDILGISKKPLPRMPESRLFRGKRSERSSTWIDPTHAAARAAFVSWRNSPMRPTAIFR
jgi:hypothetical protein